jgi:glycerophosphoryl diester phosphodiesterase
VEVDVQLTKDGVPILMHDTTVDRTTNGSGRVDQLTAEQIAQLTVKGGGRVPTLAQALAALQNRTTDLLLEIKEEQSASEVKHILSVVDKAHMTDRTIVQSFHEDVVRDAEAASPDLRVGLLRSALDSDPVATARRFSLSMYAVKYGGLAAKPTAADALTKAGVQVFVWTINSENEWRNALTWGVDGIITDRPDLLHSWRATQCERR